MSKRPKLFDFSRADAEAHFAASLERVLRNEDLQNPRPEFDPRQAREIEAMQSGGRRPEAYHAALEHHGFVFVPARHLPRFRGVVPQAEGQWRHERLGLALYPSDLVKNYPEGPEQLDRWIRTEKEKRRLTARRAPRQERQKLLQARSR